MAGPSDRDFSDMSQPTTVSKGLTRALPCAKLADSIPISLTEKPEERSTQLLQRVLSGRSVIPTRVALQSTLEQGDFRVIGTGSCGTVFEIPGTELAFKKGTKDDSIWTDYCYTNKAHNAVQDVRTMMRKVFPDYKVPQTPLCWEFAQAGNDEFWSENLQKFPKEHRTRQPIFMVGRIFPLPQAVRKALIDLYFDEDEHVQREAKKFQDNTDCLVRVYLGERESVEQHSGIYDSLRNFELRLNMMEDLDLDVANLANEMAIGLAIIHWEAMLDGMDVEFVLGSSATWDIERPRGYTNVHAGSHNVKVVRPKRRAVHLWMFDFDKASGIKLTEYDVETKLVPAFFSNDPYYPMPELDEDLWDEFCGTYLKASEAILRGKGPEVRRLPQHFLDEVLRVSKIREKWDPETDIVFG